jgi:hypothetical protein
MISQATLAAVSKYERQSGYEALHFKQLLKTATRLEQIAALRSDKRWWELHAQEVERNLASAISRLKEEAK